jgi:hypothetical protein
MPYNRDAAIDYARRFWDRPRDDGLVWLTNAAIEVDKKRVELGTPTKDGWEARFVPDGKGAEEVIFQRTAPDGKIEKKRIQGWDGLADCAHFLSRCLSAGGLKISELSVAKLVTALKHRADTKTLAERVSQRQGQRIIDTGLFKNGDMLGYFNINPAGDFGGIHAYTHSTMFVGKIGSNDAGRVTCHTKSRFGGRSFFPDDWFLDSGSYVYTFIHVAANDLPSAMPTSFYGWWKHEYDANTEYYYILRDGRARYSTGAPRSRQDQLPASDDSAYWFQEPNKVTFIWRKTGGIEVWQKSPTALKFTTTINDTTRGLATKLF